MSYDSIGDQYTFRPSATPRALALTPGTLIGGRFEVVRLLGRGGMGEVHLCRDTKVGREVAIKFLRLDLVADAPLLERFRREARAVGQLAHAHIVTLYDYEVDASGTYLVMELLRGVDLAAHVRANGPLAPAEVRRIALQVLDALEYAHARQIVHRDIKPSNLFLQENGVVKVLDFGLARSAGDGSLSIVGAGLGTADYVAPEQAEDATRADARSDQFSLGATLYFLLTGKSPRAMRERELPEAWRELVFRMAESVPEGRYADLRAVRVELQELDVREAPKPPISVVAAAPVVPATPAISRSSRPATPLVHAKPAVAGDVSLWADVLKASVDRSIVTDARLADQITAVGLPWRVYDRVTGIEMVLIPPGKYMRGAPRDDGDGYDDERPAHEVVMPRAFDLGVCPVTQGEWSKLRAGNPSQFKGERLPVERVSLDDISTFLRKSVGLRLPTEAEWEYACRAGTTDSRYGQIDAIAWYEGNNLKQTSPVGEKQANAFGLHDMLGNVWEWCSDLYAPYPSTPQVDPQGPKSGQFRVVRGGSWSDNMRSCRASYRYGNAYAFKNPYIGFRVARTP